MRNFALVRPFSNRWLVDDLTHSWTVPTNALPAVEPTGGVLSGKMAPGNSAKASLSVEYPITAKAATSSSAKAELSTPLRLVGYVTGSAVTSSTIQVSLPTGTVAGDKIGVVAVGGVGDTSLPTGFTALSAGAIASDSAEVRTSEKTLAASDISNGYVTLPGCPSFNETRYHCWFVHSTYGAILVADASARQASDATSPTVYNTGTVAPSVDGCLICVGLGGRGGSGPTAWSSTPGGVTIDHNAPTNYIHSLAWHYTQTTAGTTTNESASLDSSFDREHAGVIAFAPCVSPSITKTDRGTTQPTPATTTVLTTTSASFTPADSSLLVALINSRVSAGPFQAVLSDTFGDSGGTAWAEQVFNQADGACRTSIWTRKIGTGAASGTVTASSSADVTNTPRAIIMSLVELIHAGSATALQTQNGSTATNTTTIALGSVPTESSAVLIINYDSNGVSNPTPPPGITTVFFAGSSNGNDVTWTGMRDASAAKSMKMTGSGSTNRMTIVAVEIAASAGAIAVSGKAATSSSAKSVALSVATAITVKSAASGSSKATIAVLYPVTAKAATSSSAKAPLVVSYPITAKAPVSSSSKATLANNPVLVPKAATSTSAKATLLNNPVLVAKGATSSSSKATLTNDQVLVAKAATTSSSTAVLDAGAPMGPDIDGKAATSDSAKASLTNNPVLVAPAATSDSAKAGLSVLYPINAKAATSDSVKSTLFLITGISGTSPISASAKSAALLLATAIDGTAATSNSAKAGLSVAYPIAASAATSNSAKSAALVLTTAISGKAATSSSAKATMTMLVALVGKAATAASAKAVLVQAIPIAAKAAASNSAKAALSVSYLITAKAAQSDSAKATLGLSTALTGKSATSNNAQSLAVALATAMVAKAASAFNAKAALQVRLAISGKATTSNSAKATLWFIAGFKSAVTIVFTQPEQVANIFTLVHNSSQQSAVLMTVGAALTQLEGVSGTLTQRENVAELLELG